MRQIYGLLLLPAVVLAVSAGGDVCTNSTQCSVDTIGSSGTCTFTGNSTSGVCECNARYTGGDCRTERKAKLTAFLLSFFVGAYGGDRFYLGYIGAGVGKLILTLAPCILPYFFCCFLCADPERKRSVLAIALYVLTSCTGLGVVVWWLTDWILILTDQLPDVDGNALYHDM
eukprot:TRINITY_DN18428_c0_g1_i1.p1 TRINITY_DN18428_c0_g1~~TRINITY_DN18428_c0_g1_i1.p1  ORF type:complete len:172 (+),score=45.65 TRINITY_DN18428_c0_g1_i1:75-590(+)